MAIKDVKIARSTIAAPGKATFDVRGLCLEDMTFLISRHIGPITRALKMYQESQQDIVATGNIQGFVLSVVKDFPALASEVISVAADEHDDEALEIARRLPIGTQIAALTEITRLTVEEAGGLKNLLAEMQARIGSAGVESESATARPEKN